MLFKNFFLLITSCIVLLSCDGSTDLSTSSVQGRFVTEEGAAVKGALVRVFAIKPLDTLVMRLRRDYKDVGCDISDATEFDHRFYGKPVAEGKTGADGKFSFENLSGGPYHISVTHPDYSWRYICRKSGNLGSISTKPIIEIKGILSGDVTWDIEGQDYVVTGNALLSGQSLTIRKGVRIRLGNQRKITVYNGNVNIAGIENIPVWITSNTDSADKSYCVGLHISSSTVTIRNGAFSGASNLLHLQQSKGTVQATCFDNGGNGLQLSGCDSALQISNTILRNNLFTGMRTELSSGRIGNIISAQNTENGVEFTQNSTLTIVNSYLHGMESGVKSNGGSVVTVLQCECNSPKDAGLVVASYGIFDRTILSGDHALTVRDLSSGGGTFHKAYVSATNLYAKNNIIAVLAAPSANTFDSSFFAGCYNFTEILERVPVNPNDNNGGKPATRQINAPVFQAIQTAGIERK